jgi:hypothetical protein
LGDKSAVFLYLEVGILMKKREQQFKLTALPPEENKKSNCKPNATRQLLMKSIEFGYFLLGNG